MHLGELLRDDGLEEAALEAERREDALIGWRFLVEVAQGAAGPWRAEAACSGETSVMFPDRGDPVGPARSLCAGCPVLEECTEWADTLPTTTPGFIAGMSQRQRRERRQFAELDATA